MRIALRNCGLINQESIDEYIAADGYLALGKCLAEMKPADVVKTVKAAGLRGRGGAGFPTGLKWEIASKYPLVDGAKYVVCNADEGDPGAFMDRAIMEGDPHSVIEAMAVAAYAIGATKGFIYVRAEYPIAVRRLGIAIDKARELGLLGQNILGTTFSFDIEIKLGAGAFVCGEETALIHSIEGGRGEPTSKPPYPAESGLWKRSTNVNNVETLACVPPIILKGSEWFSSIGTSDSKGTKVFALAGQVENVGLVEVPMGTTLREIIFEIGGGIKGGKAFKAVQTGGPSGGCIPAEHLDTPIDYGNLTKIGSMMGSGGMIVLSEKDCMVSIAKFFLEFTVEESCGKCTACRVGTRRMLEVLEKICDGNGTEADLHDLKDLGETIKDTALCGLGQTAPNPVLSTMRYFWDEYLAHVKDKKCPAGSCSKLYTLKITDKCVGCTACARVCPVEAIAGKAKRLHVIDTEKCIKCDACIGRCKFGAIEKV
jgi:NADH:ubiquinone oxidoreductase subunit F (NADH-binding)/NAD-dependent dihydropyrimidine dehydrogenase PreA subunit